MQKFLAFGRRLKRDQYRLEAVHALNQHAKWLSICNDLSWRQSVPSLNLLITSTVWRQDHNGFTHQDPGFIDVVLNKRAEVTRIYMPPDVNTLLSVADHCLRSENLYQCHRLR